MNAADTNVLVYAIDRTEPVKRRTARALIARLSGLPQRPIVPWQVAVETLAQLRRWESIGRLASGGAGTYLRLFLARFHFVSPNRAVLDHSFAIYGKYSLSHWDAVLIAACIEAGVDTLYTEDMGAPRRIETVQLVNPFAP